MAAADFAHRTLYPADNPETRRGRNSAGIALIAPAPPCNQSRNFPAPQVVRPARWPLIAAARLAAGRAGAAFRCCLGRRRPECRRDLPTAGRLCRPLAHSATSRHPLMPVSPAAG